MPVVDSHTHLLPGRLGEKVRAFFLHGYRPDELAYPIDHEVIRTRMAADGVDEVWHLPYVHKPGMAEGVNEAAATTAATPGAVRVVPGASVHPADVHPADVVRRAVELHGARVLKLHCSVGDHAPDDPRLDGVWAVVSELRLPAVVHVGHGVTGETEATELAAVGRLAERFPDAPVILAHCAHPATDAGLALLDAHPGLYADLTPVMRSPLTVADADLEAHADRLLFGSDAPNAVIGAGALLADLRARSLSTRALEAITGGTATRLHAAVRA